jgi:predicted RNase H-like HicB family nuclease
LRDSSFLIARTALRIHAVTRFTRSPWPVKLEAMKQFTLEYWTDDGWYVGRLKEMPAVMSQGETLEELQAMIRDAYRLIVDDASENTFVPSERHEMAISL